MTPARIQALRELLNEATDRPWWTGPHYRGDVRAASRLIVCTQPMNSPQADADAALIAAAVNELAPLLDEVDRLQESKRKWELSYADAESRVGLTELRAEAAEAKLAEVEAWTKSPAQLCLKDRANGAGGCGACAVCCTEQYARAMAAEDTLEEVEAGLAAEREATEMWHTNALENHRLLTETEAKLAAAEAEGVRLARELAQYGEHRPGCGLEHSADADCSCGLDAALERKP